MQNPYLLIAMIVFMASGGVLARDLLWSPLDNILFLVSRVCMLLPAAAGYFKQLKARTQLRVLPPKQELLVGVVSGLVFGAILLAAYSAFGESLIDGDLVKSRFIGEGSVNQRSFIVYSTYFCIVNAFIEEILWRWYLVQKCELVISRRMAVVLASACFVPHHSLLLYHFTSSLTIVLLGSVGVFLAAIVWAVMFSVYRSVRGAYVSHALADIALAWLAWQILFGVSSLGISG